MDEIKKVITIEVNGDQTVKSLKQEISDLRDALLNTEAGSEEYKNTLNQLIEDQKKLTSVMNAGKKEVEAAQGSYNALSQEMSALKKVWREVTDEASRNEIGVRINEINDQLKEMDASIGNFQRNVGNYEGAITDATKNIMQNLGQISPELGSLGTTINQMIPIIQKTTKVATTGLKGIKKAIASTGIGLLIVALGTLVANWDKVAGAISKVIPWQKKSREETQKQIDANNALIESNKAMTEEMDFQARILAAQGKTQLEIIQYKKQETEALLANTDAQIAETNAKIASIRAHSAFGRWIRGERKQLKGLEESLESLVKEQESLTKTIKKYGQDLVVEQTKIEYERTKETKKGTEKTVKQEKTAYEQRLELLKGFAEQAKTLTESFYNDEQKLTKEFKDNQETTIKGLYETVLTQFGNNDNLSAIEDAFKPENFDDIVINLKTIFGDNSDFNEIIKQYEDLWKQIQQRHKDNLDQLEKDRLEAHSKEVKENAERLVKVREQEESITVEAIKDELQRKNELALISGDSKQIRENEYLAKKKITEQEIQTIQNYLDEYRKLLSEENLDDETIIEVKEKISEKEIELIRKVREAREEDAKKRAEEVQKQKDDLEGLLESIQTFATTIGDILGTVADYWMETVEAQVESGKMSQQEGEKQFKWIKALQIAQTTIQTLAAAMAAFNGITSATGGWGVAAAAAEMAAVIATGAIQIAKIKATQLKSSGSSNISSGTQVRTVTTDFSPKYVAAQTGASETDNLANAVAQQPIWVSVQEISSSQRKVEVKETESTF